MAWVYQWFKAEKDKIKVDYDDCFFRCPNDEKEWDETRKGYCDECPQRKADEYFFSEAQKVFKQRFGEDLSRGRFDELSRLVRNVKAYEGSDEKLGLRHQHLLTAFLTEKDKYERATRPRGSS